MRRGQAALETALTMPMVVFLFLGLLQVMLALQARALAEYAAARTVRVGSTNHAACRRMMDAAVLALLPSFTTYLRPGADPTDAVAAAFYRHGPARRYRYDDLYTTGNQRERFVGEIVWLRRTFARPITAASELDFDQSGPPQRLTVEVVYWYPLKVPFANWVVSKIALGYAGVNPFMPAQRASWAPLSLAGLAPAVAARASAGETVLPILASASMRMFSPVRDASPQCGGGP